MSPSIQGFIVGELQLTVSVVLGILSGWFLVKIGVAERILGRVGPMLCRWGVHPDLVVALALSLGTSRVATGVVASSLERGDIDRDEAVFGTLLLSFPGYLHRWVGTFGASLGLAGTAGAIYALSLLLRSLVRFALFAYLLTRKKRDLSSCNVEWRKDRPNPSLFTTIKKTLPWGWAAFCLVYWAGPLLEPDLHRLGSFVSPLVLSVAIAGVAHNTASLAAAGSAISSGSMSISEGVFALLLGNLLGTFSRVIRQNLAFWAGLFPGAVLRPLLLWHIGTLVPLMFLWVFLAAFFCKVV